MVCKVGYVIQGTFRMLIVHSNRFSTSRSVESFLLCGVLQNIFVVFGDLKKMGCGISLF